MSQDAAEVGGRRGVEHLPDSLDHVEWEGCRRAKHDVQHAEGLALELRAKFGLDAVSACEEVIALDPTDANAADQLEILSNEIESDLDGP